ncbi:MAG TPA: BACON domain-containing carbohydrate-binding protein, partial [Blastocatellia bacterium]|nr:BACON domain-containing carbohydrate-binding protein [Blastocatellia bacterium]
MFTRRQLALHLLVPALALGLLLGGVPAGKRASAHQLLPTVASAASCTSGDSWTPTSETNAPDARTAHTAVWTGSEMIVWGGVGNSGYLNTGARYDPSTDTWTPISMVNAPASRSEFTAVWTGTEMIVWGGHNTQELNTGGRYNPSTDTWTPLSTINAPIARRTHTAIWTGTEMIIWGGHVGYRGAGLSSGARYNPANDTWITTSTVNVASGREGHTAVWTGNEMIVWGGNSSGYVIDTGGRYNPASDSWSATSRVNDASARYHHSAVWTGTEMIVWGGFGNDDQGATYLNTGGRYNPASDSWTLTSTTLAPSLRGHHPALWTGSEMVIWGGYPITNTGGRYNPATNTWREMDAAAAPSGRYDHSAVWTGTEMIVWGGSTSTGGTTISTSDTGGRYCMSASACSYSITPTGHLFASTGGAGQVSLSAPGGCNWSAGSSASWIMLTSAANGSGSGTINYEVRENFTDAARTGQINIGGQSFTVMQEGRGDGDCGYVLSPTFNTFAASGGSGTISVTVGAGCGWE